MKSLEHLIYDILKENIGVIGTDKPSGPQGGFSASFSTRRPTTIINRKRNAAQQKNANPIASFESGRNNIVPNQGDATTVGDLSARGAAQESGKQPYKSIRTKLKEMYFVEDDKNTTIVKKTKTNQQPSTVDVKNTYHDTMSNNLSKLSEPKKTIPDLSNTEVLGTPIIPFPFAGRLYNLFKNSKPLEMEPVQAPKQLPAPTTNVKPPETSQTTSTPRPQQQTTSSSQGTSTPRPQQQSTSSSQGTSTTKTKEKPSWPEIETKPETPQNVPSKPGTGPAKLEPKPGNPPEGARQSEIPSPKPASGQSPSTKPGIPSLPKTVDGNISSGIGLGTLGAGGLGALLGYLARQSAQTSPVKASGFIHPSQSQLSGFTWSPLGMATTAAKNAPDSDKSHILARLKNLFSAMNKTKHAGEDTSITEENMPNNLNKERRKIENVARKDFLKNRKSSEKTNPRAAFSSDSVLSRNSAIKTRIIDEKTKNRMIKEIILEAMKNKKTKKATIGSKKTPIDINPVLQSPPENQSGRTS
jgi:hypothetical protein